MVLFNGDNTPSELWMETAYNNFLVVCALSPLQCTMMTKNNVKVRTAHAIMTNNVIQGHISHKKSKSNSLREFLSLSQAFTALAGYNYY